MQKVNSNINISNTSELPIYIYDSSPISSGKKGGNIEKEVENIDNMNIEKGPKNIEKVVGNIGKVVRNIEKEESIKKESIGKVIRNIEKNESIKKESIKKGNINKGNVEKRTENIENDSLNGEACNFSNEENNSSNSSNDGRNSPSSKVKKTLKNCETEIQIMLKNNLLAFEEYIKDKKVAIIGPSPSVTETENGAWIEDNFDVIIRINKQWKFDKSLRKYIGKRTDVLINCLDPSPNCGGEIDTEYLTKKGCKFIICPLKMACDPTHRDNMFHENYVIDNYNYFLNRYLFPPIINRTSETLNIDECAIIFPTNYTDKSCNGNTTLNIQTKKTLKRQKHTHGETYSEEYNHSNKNSDIHSTTKDLNIYKQCTVPLVAINAEIYDKWDNMAQTRINTGLMGILYILTFQIKQLYIKGFTFFLDGYLSNYRNNIGGISCNEYNSNTLVMAYMSLHNNHDQKRQWKLFKKVYKANKSLIILDNKLEKIINLPKFPKIVYNKNLFDLFET